MYYHYGKYTSQPGVTIFTQEKNANINGEIHRNKPKGQSEIVVICLQISRNNCSPPIFNPLILGLKAKHTKATYYFNVLSLRQVHKPARSYNIHTRKKCKYKR